MSHVQVFSRLLAGCAFCALAAAPTFAPADDKPAAAYPAQYERTVARGVAFLESQQGDDGSFSKAAGPAVTGLVTTALLRHGRGVNDPVVAKSLKWLEKFVQPNGGVYHPESTHRNYETCVAVLCFKAANKDGRYDKTLKGAEKFLRGLQWDEGENKDMSSTYYGGAGYGGHRRPDLSNTNFFIDALAATGVKSNDPAMKKALLFVSRCQNLESEYNTTPFAGKINDGGFYYTPADGGKSEAGGDPQTGLRSYASMTYAGLKSMIYAGVKPDDPRIKAAIEWLSQHYDLDSNPGMGTAGLYYYYHTFAKALSALGHKEFQDADGKTHDWRRELTAELASRQQPNGSWVNENRRWMESDPNLVTAYSLLALSYCSPQSK